jgi:uracil-DNA glycosylase
MIDIIITFDKIMTMINKKNYDVKSWNQYYPNNKVNLMKLSIHSDWKDFFDNVVDNKKFTELEQFLSTCIKNKMLIYPYPELIFSAFNYTPLTQIKVVIIGQDPYINNEINQDMIIVPQAMGLSFSIPVGTKIPPSLKNIYKNLLKYKHIDAVPDHGNLQSLAEQGVFMMNTVLTVQQGKSNSHASKWTWLTDSLIEYISDNTNNVVFLLWGRPAYNKVKFIDTKKHLIIASSHPSPLSYNNVMGNQKSFGSQDHFGLVNEYLKDKNKKLIYF